MPRSRGLIFAALVIAGVALDLTTKHWIFARLWPPDGRVIWLWRHYAGLELSLNEGALFGFGQGWVPLFVVLSLVAGAGVIYYLFIFGEARNLWVCIALGLITAGMIGNLYDRLGMHGLIRPAGFAVPGDPPQRIYAVRDWILLKYGDHRWPNFNVADSLLVCGASMWLLELAFFSSCAPAIERRVE